MSTMKSWRTGHDAETPSCDGVSSRSTYGAKIDGQECPSNKSLRKVLVFRVARRFEVGEQVENLVL